MIKCQSQSGKFLMKCVRREAKFVGHMGASVPTSAVKQEIPSFCLNWHATSKASKPAQEYPTNDGAPCGWTFRM
jgi:Tfp pilus assembly protein PilW